MGLAVSNEIVPFGKFKGKPVEAMAEDRKYCDWLVSQDWFREKFQPLYTVIVNNFGEPSETPEHNALQVKFLDGSYQMRFVDAVNADTYPGASFIEESIASAQAALIRQREEEAAAVRADLDRLSSFNSILFARKRAIELAAALGRTKKANVFSLGGASFECGCDVRFGLSFGDYGYSEQFSIEIKPSMGDDFPAVLRQMKRSGANTLLVGQYTGLGASFQQVVDVFDSAHIIVVTTRQVDETRTPKVQSEVTLPGLIFPGLPL